MKAVVLLSGGIDSATCLAIAVEEYGAENVLALSANYGQKHIKELEAGRKIAEYYKVERKVIDLEYAFTFSNSPLLANRGTDIKHKSYAEQLAELGGEGTVDTYVPFRNGLFLAYAAAVAVSINANAIYYGAHADDAAGRAYPDCTPEFERAMNLAIYEGSGHTCNLEAPLINYTKREVVAEGTRLQVPYELTWSCYEGKDRPCGTCGTCIDRAKAFEANGLSDPALEG